MQRLSSVRCAMGNNFRTTILLSKATQLQAFVDNEGKSVYKYHLQIVKHLNYLSFLLTSRI